MGTYDIGWLDNVGPVEDPAELAYERESDYNRYMAEQGDRHGLLSAIDMLEDALEYCDRHSGRWIQRTLVEAREQYTARWEVGI